MLVPGIQLDLWQSFSRLKGFSLAFPRPAPWICISCSYTLQWLFQALYYSEAEFADCSSCRAIN